jgi:hypothetical protein
MLGCELYVGTYVGAGRNPRRFLRGDRLGGEGGKYVGELRDGF